MSPLKKVNYSEANATNKSSTPDQDHKKSGNGVVILRVIAIVAVIGLTVYIYSIRDRVEDFAAYGYPGIFLIALMANATV